MCEELKAFLIFIFTFGLPLNIYLCQSYMSLLISYTSQSDVKLVNAWDLERGCWNVES